MGILNKPYELSIWEDKWDSEQSKFIEVKLLVLGSNTMTSQSRALSPKLVENVNGTHTLTFMIYYQYKDSMTGQTVQNPYAPYLTNERKLKLKYGNEWYDFVIKSIKEDSTKYTYDISAIDQYVNELSKNGFNFTFDAELNNNVGSVQQLAARALTETDWNVPQIDNSIDADGTEFIPDQAKETLVQLELRNAVQPRQILDDQIGVEPRINPTAITIPAGEKIYAFYSCLVDRTERFQFIYCPDQEEITKDNERVIKNKNCQYYIDNIIYSTAVYGLSVPTFCYADANHILISDEYRGARYVFSPDTQYNSIIGRYVQVYTRQVQSTPFDPDAEYIEGDYVEYQGNYYRCIVDRIIGAWDYNNWEWVSDLSEIISYYGYKDTEIKAPNLISNWVTNPNKFKSTAGWHAGTILQNATSDDKGKVQNIATRPATPGHVAATLLEDLKTGYFATYSVDQNYTPKLKYTAPTQNSSKGVLINTGFYDNRVAIRNLTYGQSFVVRAKGTGLGSKPISLCLGTVNNDSYKFTTNFATTEQLTPDLDDNGYHTAFFTVISHKFTENTYKRQNNERVYIVLDGSEDLEIEDFQIFEYVKPVGSNHYITPDDQVTTANVIDTYYLYRTDTIDSLAPTGSIQDANPVYKKTYNPKGQYNLPVSCEKRRAITIKESNYFNIIQTLCENFECWAKFIIKHNNDGTIQSKSIIFKNYIGEENFAGFRYGVNLKSISRTDDSKSIVTKLIVKQNSNEFGQNGFCTIARAPSNISKDIYIFNVDHYINQGLLSASEWNDAMYGADGYAIKLRTENGIINSHNDILSTQAVVLAKAKSDLNVAETGFAAATDTYEAACDAFLQFSGYEYTDYAPRDYVSTATYAEGDLVRHGQTCYQALRDITEPSSWNDDWVLPEDGGQEGVIYYWKIDSKRTNTIRLVEDDKNIKYLLACGEAYQAIQNFKISKDQASLAYTQAEADYKSINTQLEQALARKSLIYQAFYSKFSRFLQEGTWISEEYFDDEKYYLDALSTLYTSAVPKVTYNISVLELSQLDGYEDFTFAVGDRTYVEDPEFFGYDINGAPIREEVILNEITYNLDEPDKNSIKVQNFKTQFQDLFKKITATVQSVQFSTGAYDKAAQLADADDSKKSAYLQGALNDASTVLQNFAAQTVRLDEDGLTITDGTEPNKKLRVISGGILLTEDGGNTWSIGITPQGINAKILSTGILNTGAVNIMYGNEPTFRWDAYGITAYDFDNNNPMLPILDTGVRFDRLGVYGFTGAPGDWHPNNVVTWQTSSDTHQSPIAVSGIREHSIFEVTKEGLYLDIGKGRSIYGHGRTRTATTNNNVTTIDYTYDAITQVTHNTIASLGKVEDVLYNKWDNSNPYYTLTEQNTVNPFVKVMSVGYKTQDEVVSENFALYDDGTVRARKILVSEGIGYDDGSGLVKLAYGVNSTLPINGTAWSGLDNATGDWHKVRQTNDNYIATTYDNGAHWFGPTHIADKEIVNTTQEYLITNSGVTPLDNDPNWSTTMPSTAEQSGKILWVKIIAQRADGTSFVLQKLPLSIPEETPSYNTATIYIYKRSSSQPSDKPDDGATYTFSTKGLAGTLNGWSCTIPTGNDLLWLRAATATSTSDSDTIDAREWSVAVQLEGSTGPQGEAGRGIVSTVIHYQASEGNTTVPTGTWQTTIPSVGAGNYLWTRTTITYTSGDPSYSYSVAKQGVTGEQGATGNGISSTTVQYASSTSNTSAPTTGWQNTPPSVAAGSYLWTKTIFNYTDGTSSDPQYSIAKQGDPGAHGTDVEIQFIYYQQNTLNAPNAPTAWIPDNETSWTTTETSGVQANKYVYRAQQTKTTTYIGNNAQTPTISCTQPELYKAWHDGNNDANHVDQLAYATLLRATNNGTSDTLYFGSYTDPVTQVTSQKLYINATYINTGVLDASAVNVTNLNAGNITTGALTVQDSQHDILFRANVEEPEVLIGGFAVSKNAIYTNSITAGQLGYVYLGNGDLSNNCSIGGNSTTQWRLILGNNFGVTKNGDLYCTSGKIGGWTIGSDLLQTGSPAVTYFTSQYYRSSASTVFSVTRPTYKLKCTPQNDDYTTMTFHQGTSHSSTTYNIKITAQETKGSSTSTFVDGHLFIKIGNEEEQELITNNGTYILTANYIQTTVQNNPILITLKDSNNNSLAQTMLPYRPTSTGDYFWMLNAYSINKNNTDAVSQSNSIQVKATRYKSGSSYTSPGTAQNTGVTYNWSIDKGSGSSSGATYTITSIEKFPVTLTCTPQNSSYSLTFKIFQSPVISNFVPPTNVTWSNTTSTPTSSYPIAFCHYKVTQAGSQVADYCGPFITDFYCNESNKVTVNGVSCYIQSLNTYYRGYTTLQDNFILPNDETSLVDWSSEDIDTSTSYIYAVQYAKIHMGDQIIDYHSTPRLVRINSTVIAHLVGIYAGLTRSKDGVPIRFYAGGATMETSPFIVTVDGHLYASNAVITGIINATSGAIGGWTIDSTGISNGNCKLTSAGALIAGSGASTKFTLSNDGAITAQSGTIGGWSISNTQLYKGTLGNSGSIGLIPSGTTVGSTSNVVFCAGSNFKVCNDGTFYASSGNIDGMLFGNSQTVEIPVITRIATDAYGQVIGIYYKQLRVLAASSFTNSSTTYHLDSTNYHAANPGQGKVTGDSNWSGGGCFDPTTPITLADGSQLPIASIDIGMLLQTYNLQTKQFESAVVRAVCAYGTTEQMIDIIFIDGTYLRCTSEHPLLSDHGWVSNDLFLARKNHGLECQPLQVHQNILTANNTYKEIISIKQFEPGQMHKVYDLKVEPTHTFLANNYVVHNQFVVVK